MEDRQYIAIDLKSFYASAECVARGLDPLNTFLVVADLSRTEKTICLAVSPPLKAYGIAGRARLFEVVQRVNEVNAMRRVKAPNGKFVGASQFENFLCDRPDLALDYIVAPPRMAYYLRLSSKIVGIYLRFIAPEDIHVYSIDEVFIDATNYLRTYRMTARELAETMIRTVLDETGITATVGIGTNLYLSKIAMDIEAKHIKADKDGVRIAELDELSYRRSLWSHRPLTDFWRVGRGISRQLERYGMFTMGDVARMSLNNEELLYKLFGVNAELLIDHAWGWEPCRISDVKSYEPQVKSLSSGQVLKQPYPFDKARLIIREMTELLSLDLVKKGLATDQLVLNVGYDIENLRDSERRRAYKGEIKTDGYGRAVPRSAHGSENLGRFSSSSALLCEAAQRLFDRIADPTLSVRRVVIAANHTTPERALAGERQAEQLSLFETAEALRARDREEAERAREREIQRTVLGLQRRFGKNAVLKGFNLMDGATTMERNGQIGGHRAQ